MKESLRREFPRRDFLQLFIGGAAGILLAGCEPTEELKPVNSPEGFKKTPTPADEVLKPENSSQIATPPEEPIATPNSEPRPTSGPIPTVASEMKEPIKTLDSLSEKLPPTSGLEYAEKEELLPTATATELPAATSKIEVWVEVDLSEQELIFHGEKGEIRKFPVSTGKNETPTVTGEFNIRSKFENCRMRGPGYDTPDVPYCMYFYEGYALYGAYWHHNFGHPMSHGCVNLEVEKKEGNGRWTGDAEWIYEHVEIGTKVVVHG